VSPETDLRLPATGNGSRRTSGRSPTTGCSLAHNRHKVAYDRHKVAYDRHKVAYDRHKVAYDRHKVAYNRP
jgi:hypothetical protein